MNKQEIYDFLVNNLTLDEVPVYFSEGTKYALRLKDPSTPEHSTHHSCYHVIGTFIIPRVEARDSY